MVQAAPQAREVIRSGKNPLQRPRHGASRNASGNEQVARGCQLSLLSAINAGNTGTTDHIRPKSLPPVGILSRGRSSGDGLYLKLAEFSGCRPANKAVKIAPAWTPE